MDFPLEFQDPPGFAPEFSPESHPCIIGDEDFILFRSVTNPEGGVQGMPEQSNWLVRKIEYLKKKCLSIKK